MEFGLTNLLSGSYAPADMPFLALCIAQRFAIIVPTLKERVGDYEYDGLRCSASEVGYRPYTTCTGIPDTVSTPFDVLNGEHDDIIEEIWHERASAEHWYRHEKDWG